MSSTGMFVALATCPLENSSGVRTSSTVAPDAISLRAVSGSFWISAVGSCLVVFVGLVFVLLVCACAVWYWLRVLLRVYHRTRELAAGRPVRATLART